MNLREAISGLLSSKLAKEEAAPTQEEIKKSVFVDFFDLREAEAAEKRKVKPGYYFTVYPIDESDLEDNDLLPKLSFILYEKLEEEGLLESSNVHIHIDNQAEEYIDPAECWRFTGVGHIKDSQLLIVRADQEDPDQTQKMIMNELNGK